MTGAIEILRKKLDEEYIAVESLRDTLSLENVNVDSTGFLTAVEGEMTTLLNLLNAEQSRLASIAEGLAQH